MQPIWWITGIIVIVVVAVIYFFRCLATSAFDPYDEDKADWIQRQKERDWEYMERERQHKDSQSK